MHEGPASSRDLHEMTSAWWILVLLGAVAIAAGVIVLAKPSNSLATLAVVTGVFVLLDGIVAVVEAVTGSAESRGLVAILGVVSVAVGILLIRHPVGGVKAVALLLGIWLIAGAVVRLVAAFAVPGHRLRRLLAAAILAVAGIAIVSEPHIGYATLAVITGIGFIGYGAAMIALGWALRKVEHGPAAGAAPHPAATT